MKTRVVAYLKTHVVAPVGIEPTRLSATDFKSAASACFAKGPSLSSRLDYKLEDFDLHFLIPGAS